MSRTPRRRILQRALLIAVLTTAVTATNASADATYQVVGTPTLNVRGTPQVGATPLTQLSGGASFTGCQIAGGDSVYGNSVWWYLNAPNGTNHGKDGFISDYYTNSPGFNQVTAPCPNDLTIPRNGCGKPVVGGIGLAYGRYAQDTSYNNWPVLCRFVPTDYDHFLCSQLVGGFYRSVASRIVRSAASEAARRGLC
jgi:hypothetical protein